MPDEGDSALPSPGASWTRARQPPNSLIAPAQHLDADAKLAFYSGFSFFRSPWVSAPASTTARDGLGPLFNSHSCDGCHRNGGRGKSLLDDPHSLATVVRISVRERDGGPPRPHPRFGHQFQTQATYAGGVEAQISMQAVAVGASLREPRLQVRTPQATESQADWLLSARVAPPLIGMGLLADIAADRLLAHADADDRDGDGVSGRPHWRGERIGRFGWKALHASVATQTGAAFRDDIGITNPLFPDTVCGALQTECHRQPNGNDGGAGEVGVEIPSKLFDLVVHFVAHIPPPKAGPLTDAVRLGRETFAEIGCGNCHVPSHPTRFGRIWPYTDLLLHDMGEGLADHRPEGNATGREWRTPPLWGLGTMAKVSGHRTLLHDGRARDADEAIRWHGGEAAAAQQRYHALSHEQRRALLAFLNAI